MEDNFKNGREMRQMKKVAILYICTGQYTVFWRDFYDSYEKFFLPESKKEYYVFTDAKELYQMNNERVHIVYQKDLGWPDNTLMRYHMFYNIKENLDKYDYIYFMNANCLCVDEVNEKEFCFPGLLVVQHPGYFDKKNSEFTYERNSKSTAYIPAEEGEHYICGGINGGSSGTFLEMTESIKTNIDIDKKHHVVALWHDESHINRYIFDHPEYTMLSPSYCYPEGWNIPFHPKIVVRNKEKWIDLKKAKREKLSIVKFARKIARIIS